MKTSQTSRIAGFLVAYAGVAFSFFQCANAQTTVLEPAKMPRIGSVDERFQSYNIEMVEVTGGRFWKPFDSPVTSAAAPQSSDNQPGGMNPSLYEYRAPIDLSNRRLRKLAAELAADGVPVIPGARR